MNKPHPLPQSESVLKYKLDSRDYYQKGTPQPSLSKLLESKTQAQDIPVSIHITTLLALKLQW